MMRGEREGLYSHFSCSSLIPPYFSSTRYASKLCVCTAMSWCIRMRARKRNAPNYILHSLLKDTQERRFAPYCYAYPYLPLLLLSLCHHKEYSDKYPHFHDNIHLYILDRYIHMTLTRAGGASNIGEVHLELKQPNQVNIYTLVFFFFICISYYQQRLIFLLG